MNQNITIRVLLRSSPFIIVILPVLPFCMGYLEETCRTWFDILIYASTTQKDICPLELSLFIYIPTIVYQLIVRSNCASMLSMLLFLWSVKPFYFRMTRRNKLQYLIHIQVWVKVVVFCRSNANPAFALFYPGVLPPLCQDCHENCTISYEFLMQ